MEFGLHFGFAFKMKDIGVPTPTKTLIVFGLVSCVRVYECFFLVRYPLVGGLGRCLGFEFDPLAIVGGTLSTAHQATNSSHQFGGS